MSHHRRSLSPDGRATYSLLVYNIAFRTSERDLYPLFAKYGTVIDVFIPRDRRTWESRGFAFVRFKYEEEAQMAVDRLNGRNVDGREISVQFAKYGPNSEPIHKGKIIETPKTRLKSRSRSPKPRYVDDYRRRDYRMPDQSHGKYDYQVRERDYYPSRSRSISPDYYQGRKRSRYEDVDRFKDGSFDRQWKERPRNNYDVHSSFNGSPRYGYGV